jgi:CelD/BcsL family acetyltransferase involved in cellulose biosynthesis
MAAKVSASDFRPAIDRTTAAIASVRRASAADRSSAMEFRVECRPLAELAPIADAWRELAAHAIEPNVFYEPGFALAAAPVLGADVVVGLVWSVPAPQQLVGLFPVRIDSRRYGLPISILVGWTHPYGPLGTPLIHREMAEPVIAAWLNHVAGDAALPDLILLRLMAADGPFATALNAVLARYGCEVKSFDRHDRALLSPGEQRDGYLDKTMVPKRRKELRRKQRRLAELGVTVVEAKGDSDVVAPLDDFFALEAGGWKGRAGTAAMLNQGIHGFMRQAVISLAQEGKAVVHRLLVDGKAIAAMVTLKSGNAAWGWKIAYDETYSPYSPGGALIAGLTESILADPTIARADSCANGRHLTIGQLWRERLVVMDCLVTASSGSELSFAFVSQLEALRRMALNAAKSLRDLLRRT